MHAQTKFQQIEAVITSDLQLERRLIELLDMLRDPVVTHEDLEFIRREREDIMRILLANEAALAVLKAASQQP